MMTMKTQFFALTLLLALSVAQCSVEPASASLGSRIKMWLRGGRREQTLAILKPDAVGAGKADAMKSIIKAKGFEIVKEKQLKLSDDQAKNFYKEHEGKPFYPSLVQFMTSNDAVVMVLEKDDAIKSWRALMGPTNSLKAKEEAKDSLRAQFGTDGSKNACHGSDSPASAAREIKFFFE